MSREKLLGYLWPESGEERASHTLSVALHLFKKNLGGDAVCVSAEVLRLNPEVVWTDVRELEEALELGDPAAAVEVYGGPFLDGVHLGEALEFERWVEGERERYAGLFARALEALALEAEDQGDYGRAAEWWKRLAAQDPYDSRLVVRVMEALAAAGDVANALQHAHVHELLLKQELDVEPSAEVLAAAERLREASAARPVAERALGSIEGRPAELLEEPGKPTYRLAWARWALVAGALIAALVGAIALLVDWPAFRAPAAERPSVAVLPFDNLSGDPENEYFSDGITDDIITHLSMISGLKVISRHSSMQYKDSEKSLHEIAEELGVANILEGSVRREGDRVRINAQLVDAASDEHLWAEQYSRAMTDIFAIQNDAAQQIASALKATLTPAEEEQLAQVPTDNLDAYEYYLRGKYYNYSSSDCYVAEDCANALQMYEQAVRLDPDFALAYARLSATRSFFYHNAHDPSSERLASANEAVDRAFHLQPDLPDAHWALGWYHYVNQDYARALEQFQTVLESQPNNSEVLLSVGYVRRRWGEWEQAAKVMRAAAELDPRNATCNWQLAVTYAMMRNYPDAERYFNRAISLAPDVGYIRGLASGLYLLWEGSVAKARLVTQGPVEVEAGPRRWGWPWLQAWSAYLDVLDGRYQEALERLAPGSDTLTYYFAKATIYDLLNQPQLKHAYYDSLRIVAEAGVAEYPVEARFHGILGIAYAGLGRKDDAVREGQRAVELLPVSEDAFYGTSPVQRLGEIYVMVGEPDAAIDQLEWLLFNPSWLSGPWVRVDPIWDPLHDHPRFQALLERYDRQH